MVGNHMDVVHKFVLKEVKSETEDVKSFVFSPENDFVWRPGQYLDWQLPHDNPDERGQRRWFSISTSPSEKDVMLSCRFASDGSSLKKRLLSLRVGDIVEAKGPMGDFTVDVVTGPMVLIAGGIGITPFRSILVQLAAERQLHNVQLVYGNRSPDNIPFRDELDRLAAQNPGFGVHYVFSPKRIDVDVLGQLGFLSEGVTYMISGLEKMVESIRESLVAEAVPPETIRVDDFGGYDWHLDKPVF